MKRQNDVESNEHKPKPAKKNSNKASKKTTKTQVHTKQPKAKGIPVKPVLIPRATLEQAIKITQLINDKFDGKSASVREVFREASPISTGSRIPFLPLISSAEMYGLIKSSIERVSLTEVGMNVVAPTSPEQRQSALLKAFSSVEVFSKVAERYAGKRLPEREFFKNTLIREFDVPRDRADFFIDIFMSNVEYMKAFSPDTSGQPILSDFSSQQSSLVNAQGNEITSTSEIDNVREFLDTCFILMPFGTWFDRYYKEIYVPATRDAGFEPLRADGLFNVGAVMEQIWTQIQKARVLLADLTGKNPNVFYELGLAHALRKPVVFVAGDIEDVPFDVRHLRVVVYDVREPLWAEKLKTDITAYLRSTRNEPEKSIPQPFRESVSEQFDRQEDSEQMAKNR